MILGNGITVARAIEHIQTYKHINTNKCPADHHLHYISCVPCCELTHTSKLTETKSCMRVVRVCQTFCEHIHARENKKKNRPFDCGRSHAIFNHHFSFSMIHEKESRTIKKCVHTHTHSTDRHTLSLDRYLCSSSSSSTFSTSILHYKKWSHFKKKSLQLKRSIHRCFYIFSFTDFSICRIRFLFSVSVWEFMLYICVFRCIIS